MEQERSRCQWITDWYIALLLLVFPFYVSGDYTTLTAGKYHLFLILCGGYVLVMAFLSLRERELGQGLRPERGWAFIYLMLTIFSAVFSPYDGVWLGNGRREGALSIAIYVLGFYFLSRYGQVKRRQIWLLGISASAFAAICLLQIAGGNPLGLYPGNLDYADAGTAYNGAFLGTMGNAGLSGAWLSLAVPMVFAAVVLLRKERRWLMVPLLLGGATVALMDVSAAVVGVAGGVLLSLPVLAPKEKHVMVLGFTVAVITGIAAVIWAVPLPGTAGELHAILHGSVEESFGSGRIGIWRQLLERVPRQALLGSGPDTVGLLGLAPFVREMADGTVVERAIDVAHNEYLQILICQGALALISYLGVLIVLCLRWVKCRSTAGKILGCGILGYCIQGFFSFSMCITAPLFWLALGLLSSVCAAEAEKEGAQTGAAVVSYHGEFTGRGR